MAIAQSQALQVFAAPLEFGLYEAADYLAVFASAIAEGVGQATLAPPLELNRNTIVRKYDLRLRAAHAPRAEAQKIGQVRVYSTGGVHTVVIDFGTPRTVSRVSVPAGTVIREVSAWAGAQFGFPFYEAGTSASAPFPSEVRAERLLIKLDKALPQATAGQDVELEIPDLPADLELRINDAPPVFTNPGAVAPTAGLATLATDRWNQDSERLVPLADALNALGADPLADAMQTLAITLTSKVPGELALTADPAPQYSHIHRVAFAGGTETALTFDTEGTQTLELPLPALPAGRTRRLEEIRLTALAKLDDERVLPPVGPLAAPLAGDADPPLPLAELLLDTAHAVCLRLVPGPLATLAGLRLPLAVADGGAEARIVLWKPADDPTGDPAEPLPGAASEPLALDAGAEAWVTFRFAKPVPLDPAAPPWAALVVTRGALRCSLAAAAAPSPDPLPLDAPAPGTVALLRGAPNGPWRTLPALLLASPPAGLLAARARVRLVGQGAKAAPVAPLVLGLHGRAAAGTDLTPNAKGLPLTLSFDPPVPLAGANPTLALQSRVAGTLTLRDIDVVWNDT